MVAVGYADRTALVASNPSPLPSFASVGEVIPGVGDLDWYILDARFAKLFATVLGTRSQTAEWVYWNGAVTALPAASIVDPTNRFGTQPTAAYTSRDVRSTFSSAAWGSSGVFADTGIPGDGYVEGRATSPVIAAGFIGLSVLDDAGLTYTGIDYAWHFGHGGGAFCSIWSNGVQQAGLTFALAVGDVLRVERKGTSFLFLQNGILRHTITSTPAGTYKPDLAFISLSGLDQIELVDKSRGYPVHVPFDWASNTLVTATARVIQAPTQAERVIAAQLPADADQLTIGASTGFALGVRTTSAPGVVRPAQVLVRALPLSGAGVTGPRFTAARTITRFGIHAKEASLGASRFLLVNASTGQSMTLDLPQGARHAEADGSLAFAAGQSLTIIQMTGHGTVEPGDGAWILQ